MFCYVMHVLDYTLDGMSKLFRFNNYPLDEKAYNVIPHASLTLRTFLRDTM